MENVKELRRRYATDTAGGLILGCVLYYYSRIYQQMDIYVYIYIYIHI